MTEADILRTIEDYATTAMLAREAGYDGVEIMGSEGYLINEFTAPRTNDRGDDWGGSLENRLRLPVAIMARVRERVGKDFLVIFRVSSIDLVEGGLTAEEIAAEAKAVEAAGADVINQGIGWHEARVPTIAQKVPRAAWTFAARLLEGRGEDPGHRLEPHQHAGSGRSRAGARRCRPRVDGAADAGRCRVRQQGARGPGRRDQRLHRLQPGLPRPHILQARGDLPGQPEGRPRDRVRRAAAVARQASGGGGCRAGGPRLRRDGGRARAPRDALRGGGAHRRPAQPGAQRAGQGGVRRDAALLSHPHRAPRHRPATRPAPEAREALAAGGFDEIVIATGVTPTPPRHPRHRARALRELRRHPQRRAHGRAPRRHHRRGRHRLRRGGVPDVGSAGAWRRAPEHFAAEWGVDADIASRGGLARPPSPCGEGLGVGGAPTAKCLQYHRNARW